jgi:hypothetical protein
VTNPGEKELSLTLNRLTSGRARLLLRPVHLQLPPGRTVEFPVPVRLPPGLVPGEQELRVSLGFEASEVRVAPQEGTLSFRYLPALGFAPLPAYILYLLIAAAVVALAVSLTFLLRNRLRDLSFERFWSVRRGQRPLVFKVLDQNPYIGTRNIRAIPPGRSCSVGGDGSNFLIYYLPMPKRIGDIRNTGKQYIFIPRRRERFVSLEKPLVDCLNVAIEALSLRGQPVRFVFQEYVSPAEAINRLMLSVRQVRDQNSAKAR